MVNALSFLFNILINWIQIIPTLTKPFVVTGIFNYFGYTNLEVSRLLLNTISLLFETVILVVTNYIVTHQT